VNTDHKPLVTIFNDLSPNKLHALKGGFSDSNLIKWTSPTKRGACEYPAGFMPCHSKKNMLTDSWQQKIAEEFVDYLVTTFIPKVMKVYEITTAQNPTLKAVIGAIWLGNWYQPSSRLYILSTLYILRICKYYGSSIENLDSLSQSLILSLFTYAIEVWGCVFYSKCLSTIDKLFASFRLLKSVWHSQLPDFIK